MPRNIEIDRTYENNSSGQKVGNHSLIDVNTTPEGIFQTKELNIPFTPLVTLVQEIFENVYPSRNISSQYAVYTQEDSYSQSEEFNENSKAILGIQNVKSILHGPISLWPYLNTHH